MMIKILMFALIPLCIVCINELPARPERRLLLKNALITLLPAYVVTGIAYTVLDQLTVFEISLIGAITAALIDILLLPVIRKSSDLKSIILKTVCTVSILVVSYSILTYGQTLIHSDTATATLLCKSIAEHRNFFPATWNYANGDIWVLNNHLFVLLPSLLMENQSLARMIGSLIFVLLTLCGVVYQSRKMFHNNSWMLSIPLFIVFIYEPGVNATGDFILYQAAYTGQILWIALCGALLYEIYRTYGNPSKKHLAIYGVLMILLLIGGPRMLAEQTLPALCAGIILIYAKIRESEEIDWKNTLKKAGYMSAAVLIPSAVGFGIYKWLCTWHSVNPTQESNTVFTDSLSNVWNNIVTTFLNFFECFGFSGSAELLSLPGFRNLISVVMCIIICLIVPILQWKKLKQETEAVQLFFAYGVVHNLIILIMAALITNKTQARYMLTSVFILTIISARYIYTYWICQTNFRQYVWTGLFAFATTIECIILGLYSIEWTDTLDTQKEFAQELAAYGITKGYATYWNAYINELYSDFALRFGGITIENNNILQVRWLVDSAAFESTDTETFLLLSQSQNDTISPYLNDICGQPIDNFWLNGKCIYVFDHDIAADFSNGLADGILKPRELTLSETAYANRDEVTLPPGASSYGPYEIMKAGEYTVTFYGEQFDLCDYDIYSNEYEDAFSYEELERTNDHITVQLSITSKIDDIEFRIFNETETDTIHLYEITVSESEQEIE